MADWLQKKGLQKFIKTIGLPLPVPVDLPRQKGSISLSSNDSYEIQIESQSNLKDLLEDLKYSFDYKADKFNGLVFDARMLVKNEDLKALYFYFNKNAKKLRSNGRVVILSNLIEEDSSLEFCSTTEAITGFSRALSKELGKRGSTVQLLQIEKGLTELRCLPSIDFFLSKASAFMTGQVLELTSTNIGTSEINIEQSLKGKTALITGGARGIGAETAKVLSREGAKVILLDIPSAEENLKKLANELKADYIPVDVTQPDVLAKIREKSPNGIDILINNAGITRDKTIFKMTEDYWDLVIKINLKAAIDLTEGLLDSGLNDGGSIIGLSSISGIAGNLGQTNYSASKAGMMGLMKKASKAGAFKGINANAIAPGFIETTMTDKLPFFVKEVARRMSSLAQGGKPEDIAEVIRFFVSPGGAVVSGQTIRVCGGSFIGR